MAPRTAADGPPAIVAERFTRRFGDFTAVDHVSFNIGRSEIFGFIGSNGCGKTTTMKMLTGVEGAAGIPRQALACGNAPRRYLIQIIGRDTPWVMDTTRTPAGPRHWRWPGWRWGQGER